MSNQQNTSRCGFCGRARNEVKALISGGEKTGPFICNHCVDQAHKTIEEQMRSDPSTKEEPLKKPCEIQVFLDEHVIGQTLAKREVAIAVYEHYKRREALRRGRITIDTEDGVEVVELEKSNIILMGPSGCHRKGQLILMHDGTLEAVEDIGVGSLLMGLDGTPRQVLKLHRGKEPMVQICPVKGEPWVVNENHILTLVRTGKKNGKGYQRLSELVDVSVREWLSWSRTRKSTHKLFRVGVDFEQRQILPLDPYFLGVLLGDGTLSGTPKVTTESREILREVRHQAKQFGLRVVRHDHREGDCPVYALSGKHGGEHSASTVNPIALELANFDLWGTSCGEKFIPHIYQTASRKDRLALLAGLLDTDGHLYGNNCFDFVSKSKALLEDTAFVARSLGFAAYPKPCVKRSQHGTEGVYYRMVISGDTCQIPTRIPSKMASPRKQRKDVLRTGFTAQPLGTERFYGFTVDGDHRYLLGDFTVTHNCGKTHIARAVAKMLRIPFYVADATRLTQAGYVGDDVESLLQGLIADADGDLERAQWGIIFIDEFDKLARKSGRGASGYRDVTGEGVQQALLKLLEGTRIPVPRGMGNKMVFAGGGGADMIDTTNILFIGAGSFAGIEEIVERRINKGTRMGFGGGEKTTLDKTAVYSQVTEEDILEFGMIPELVGRMPVLTTVLDLTEEELIRVLTEPKSAIIKQFRAMYAMENIDLQFDPAALKLIAQRAKKHPTGARALRSVVKKVLSPYSFDAPSDSTIRAIRITEEAVSEPGKAIIVREGVRTASA